MLALLPCVFVLWFIRLVFPSVSVHKRMMATSCLVTLLCLGPFVLFEKTLLYFVVVKGSLPAQGGQRGQALVSSFTQVRLACM